MEQEIFFASRGAFAGFLISLPLGPLIWVVLFYVFENPWREARFVVAIPIIIDNLYANLICWAILYFPQLRFTVADTSWLGLVLGIGVLVIVYNKWNSEQKSLTFWQIFFLAIGNIPLIGSLWLMISGLTGERCLEGESSQFIFWFPIGFILGNIGMWTFNTQAILFIKRNKPGISKKTVQKIFLGIIGTLALGLIGYSIHGLL